MQVILLFLFFQKPKEVCVYPLPVKRIVNVYPEKVAIQPDGTITMISDCTILHYDLDGKELNKFGRYGKGPGEFRGPTAVAFNGENYYVSDFHSSINVFDLQGNFLTKDLGHIKNVMISEKKNIFGTVFSSYYDWESSENYQKVNVVCQIANMELCEPQDQFCQISELNSSEFLRGSRHYVAEGAKIWVLGQLDQTIFEFSSSKDLVQKIPFSVPNWVAPRGQESQGNTREQIRNYWSSYSRFYGIWKYVGDEFLIYYITPNENNDSGFDNVVVRVNSAGKLTRKPFVQEGVFLGVFERDLFFMESKDDDSVDLFPEYEVRRFKWE